MEPKERQESERVEQYRQALTESAARLHPLLLRLDFEALCAIEEEYQRALHSRMYSADLSSDASRDLHANMVGAHNLVLWVRERLKKI